MNKMLNQIIMIIGVILLGIVFLENLLFTSVLSDDINEHVDIIFLGLFNIFITVLLVVGIYEVCKKINTININKKIKISVFVIFILIYIAVQIVWINYRNLAPVGDQLSAYQAAQTLYESDGENLANSGYMERYPQQITLSYVWSIIFRICSTSSFKVIQYMNAIFNAISIVAILLIIGQLSKKYKTNKWLGIALIGTFASLPLLSTFVYGDVSGLALSLLSIYFIMKYGETDKIRFIVLSAVLMAFSYILRMNNLIFIIAIFIYLFLELIKKKRNAKEILIKIALIASFILITILPAQVIKQYITNKFSLNLDNAIPTTCFLYMGMTDGYRQSGWYNDNGAWAWDNPVSEANEMYKTAIKDRVKFFATNPFELIKFYFQKTASMWSENTYASIWYNSSFNISDGNKDLQKDEWIISKKENIAMYQKALILIIFGVSIVVLIQNRKNLSNELILLVTIFIGGFLFHVMWEAKSRYIIPYIIVLIPVATICINKIQLKFKRKEG